ncbi:hypothetical protein B0H14DRAFT_2598767 [Mycena olivaceomarginata]|nr:hypothetical protein B0H14DRAFT_2598767 [Mycena olivaceomarginata]
MTGADGGQGGTAGTVGVGSGNYRTAIFNRIGNRGYGSFPHIDHGVHLYYLRPVIAAQYRTALETLVSIIHCAANDINPWLLRLAQNIPTYINKAKLCEFGLHTGPGLSLFCGYLGVMFEALYHSCEEVWEVVELLGKVIPYFVFWIATVSGSPSSMDIRAAGISVHPSECPAPSFYTMRDEADRNEMDFGGVSSSSPLIRATYLNIQPVRALSPPTLHI